MRFHASRVAVIATSLMLLGGCASKDVAFYRHSPSTPMLEVPPDLTKAEVDDSFDIPQIGALLSKQPPLAGGASVRLERDGRLRYLVMAGEPKEFWRWVRDFWVEGNVVLAWENPALGIMETEWIKRPDSRFSKDRFRIRVEPGREPGTTQLYVSHRGVMEEFVSTDYVPVWTKEPSDPELEIEVMGQLLQFFGASAQKQSAIAAQAKEPHAVAMLELEGDVPAVVVKDTYVRVWGFALLAVDRVGDLMETRDKEAGIIVVRLGEHNQDRGFVPGIAVSGLRPEKLTLKVAQMGETVRINVLDANGKPTNAAWAKDYLTALRHNIK